MALDRNAAYGTTCTKCGRHLTIAEWFERMSDGQVHYLWYCTNCGNKFETAIYSSVDIEAKMGKEDWEQMFPPLLVS